MNRTLILLVVVALASPAAGEVFVITGPNGYRKIVNVPDGTSKSGRVPRAAEHRRANIWPTVEATCREHGIDARLVDLMIRMESGYNVRAVSAKGARGLMQLMPGTAAMYQVGDSFDPVENVRGGVRYFRDLLGRFGSDVRLALAAYNAGPEAVARYGGVPPYRETRNYVQAILAEYQAPYTAAGASRPVLTGGFGRTPARPVTLTTGGGGPTISNAAGGDEKLARRLALH